GVLGRRGRGGGGGVGDKGEGGAGRQRQGHFLARAGRNRPEPAARDQPVRDRAAGFLAFFLPRDEVVHGVAGRDLHEANVVRFLSFVLERERRQARGNPRGHRERVFRRLDRDRCGERKKNGGADHASARAASRA